MSDEPLKILMVASEIAPFAKTGGLADVVGSLPQALAKLGHEVRLIMPWYRSVPQQVGKLALSRRKLAVPLGGRVYQCGYRAGVSGEVATYFLDAPQFYDRPELYGEAGEDYPDNAERFALLSRAALELTRLLDFAPDVIHCHDWQTGLVPVYLKHKLWRDPFFADTRTLFSIHNLGYQGIFPLEQYRQLDLEQELLGIDGLEYHGRLSLLKAGIRFADLVNTVSPSYCEEIKTPQQGMGMDGLLRARGEQLHGILNGLDGQLWNPQHDTALAHCYSAKDISGKALCKQALQRELGLKEQAQTPIVAMVTRLDSQKGIELVLESWDHIMAQKLQLVILGSGNPDYERCLTEAAAFYPGQAKVLPEFDDALSRRIYAGSDLFLMPSRYEPCGLGQLIALRYGAVPLAHATGGLADTIYDPEDALEQAPDLSNGFLFKRYRHDDMLAGLKRVLNCYAEPEKWRKLQQRGMAQDMSWQKAAEQYVELYRKGA
ncbi:MAG: glycogen synthase GlgA [Desulfuromonadales bacterium]|nr:glycogen synthase GlgA [Desulfuromonadales bacterium]